MSDPDLFGEARITLVESGQMPLMAVPMPTRVAPMMASPGEPPRHDAARWGLELKWDGVRAISYISPDGVRATGRRGTEITGCYPELAGLAELLPGRQVILDGEVVAFDATGRPSFELLQRRMHVARPDRHVLREVPVRYVVFDLLFLDGHFLYELPYADRRELLDALELTAGAIEAPSHLRATDAEQIVELLELTRERHLEGLVAKRLDSPYRPGRRVDYWRKVKNLHTQEVVVGGWKPGKGRRAGGIGSLLLGVYEGGRLCFVGHVGTGFTDQMLDEMAALLGPLEIPASPYDEAVPPEFARGARWVRPRLVGEVAYAAWTAEHRLRAPSWRGLRDDKNPTDVIREP